MHNGWSCRLILLGCSPVFSRSRQWAAVSPWDSGSLLPLCILLQPRKHTTKHRDTWKDDPKLLRGCSCIRATENPSHGTQLRSAKKLQAQKSKNAMPEHICCLALAVPAPLSTWLFFFKKESPRNCCCAGNHRSRMVQGSLPPSWSTWAELPPLPREHHKLFLLPMRLPGPPCCPDGRHGPLSSCPWKHVACGGRGGLGLRAQQGLSTACAGGSAVGRSWTGGSPVAVQPIKNRRVRKQRCCRELGESSSFFHVLTHGSFAALVSSALNIVQN